MDINKYLISDDTPISEAIRRIDEGKRKIVFCVHDKQLTGSFTDGDMRRYILRDGDMHKPVSQAMNKAPISLTFLQEREARVFIEQNLMVALPIVNEKHEVVKIYFRDELGDSVRKVLPENIPLVIMAGGKGTRLYPYTQILPKPLIPIGDMPIMDHIIARFGNYGVRDIYMVLNHKRNMIKAYYNETKLPYKITYIEEEAFLGTGGGLSLLKGKLHSTFFVSNCDCLLDADYMCMYEYHKKHNNAITMIVATKSMTVPYGVVGLSTDGAIETVVEKPEYDFLVNTGIYLIEPFVIDMLSENKKIDLPDIVKQLMSQGFQVGGYPITEKSWLDMGQFAEMQNMLKELDIR